MSRSCRTFHRLIGTAGTVFLVTVMGCEDTGGGGNSTVQNAAIGDAAPPTPAWGASHTAPGGHAGSGTSPAGHGHSSAPAPSGSTAWSNDPRQQFVNRHGADKVVTVVVTDILGNQEDAGEYIRRKLVKAAQHDSQQDLQNARNQTESNRKAAEQKAIEEGRFIYHYKPAEATLGYTTVQVVGKSNGTWTYVAAPVLSIDGLAQRFQVGQTTGIDSATRTLTVRSAVPDPAPDYDVEEMIATHGAEKVATLWVTGAVGDKDRVSHFLHRRATDLDPARLLYVTGPKQIRPGDYRITVAPVTDFEMLTKRVRFGTVEAADPATREMRVAARLPADLPAPPPPNESYSSWDEQPKPGEDSFEWAIRAIKGQGHGSAKAAYESLQSVEPDPAHLPEVSEVLAAVLPNVHIHLEEHLETMVVWNTPEGTQAIMDRLRADPSPFNAEKYMKALARLKTPEAAKVLIGYLPDRFRGEHAAKALLQMGPAAEDPVLEMLDNLNIQVRAGACQILWGIGTEKSVTALRARMNREKDRQLKLTMKNTAAAIDRRLKARAEGASEEPSAEEPDADGEKPDRPKSGFQPIR